MSEISNLIIDNDKLTFEFEGKTITLKKSQVYPQIKVMLSTKYRQELYDIQKKHQLNLKASIMLLLDLYYLKTPAVLDLLLQLILQRLEKGINHGVAIRLKSIYIALGHFLKKYRYID